jgi:hypothetical protein
MQAAKSAGKRAFRVDEGRGQPSSIYAFDPSALKFGKTYADGGATGNVGAPVACVLAGGEFVLSPDQVLAAGDGDMDAGHKALDAFVNQYRAKTIKTLKGLPGPKRD